MTDQLAFTSPARPKPGTHNAKVLDELEDAGTVCGDFFLRMYMPRYPARIYDP